LLRAIPELPPETLHQLIRHAGLDACGDLVALATPEQLTSILDLDLWRSAQPGQHDRFDADRFGEWLEVLVDMGADEAARIVASLDDALVIAGLSKYVRVVDPATMAARPEGLHCDVGGYLVRATRTDAWDAIVSLLVALDDGFHDTFHSVMRGCRRLSNSAPEIDGLDNLLTAPEQLMHDVAVDREDRRSRVGYTTTADARAFLEMARQRRQARDGPPAMNPVAVAYFRDAAETTASIGRSTRAQLRALDAPPRADVDESFDVVVDWLAEAGVVAERPRALLEGPASQRARPTRMRSVMQHIHDADENAYLARSRELAFLTNALMAGCSVQSRPFTAPEASEAAVAVCNLGLEHWPTRWPDARTDGPASTDGSGSALPDAFLVSHDLVTAFEVGWAVLHEDVSMFVAERLITTLTDLQCIDEEIQRDLNAFRRQLVKQRDAGMPWRARDAADVLATLDPPAWVSVLGLLDECPVLPAALTATLEGHVGSVSATAFEFISTTGQIDAVRAFIRKLLDILSG
jgi:hypothetical protein